MEIHSPTSEVIQGKSLAKSSFSNYSLLLPYFLPYAAFVIIANFPGSLPQEANYALRLVIVPGILVWAWRWYVPLGRRKGAGASVGYGVACGIVGLVLWIVLLKPFAPAGAQTWDMWPFVLRLLAASTIVPLAEELLMRGYILRLAYQWDHQRQRQKQNAFHRALFEQSINEIETVKWSLPAVVFSTAAFTLGHQVWEWPAAVGYGLLMCILTIKRQDLLACIVAHAVTNFTLGMYVYSTGQWQYW